MFAITDAASFEPLHYWLQELNYKADIASIELLLVGTKNDFQQARHIQKSKAA